MKLKKLICLVLSLVAVCSLMLVRDTAAWFVTTAGSSPTGTIQVEKMIFDFNGTLGSFLEYPSGATSSGAFVLTDQNLITDNDGKITVTNHSSVKTQVRFRIRYETVNSGNVANTVNCYHDDSGALRATIDTTEWTLTSDNGDYYYERTFETTDTSEIVAVSDIEYKDSLIQSGTDVMDPDVYLPEVNGSIQPTSARIVVDIQARQYDNISWSDVGWTDVYSTSTP